MKKQIAQPSPESRFNDYLKHGESAAMYMNGLADAWYDIGELTDDQRRTLLAMGGVE